MKVVSSWPTALVNSVCSVSRSFPFKLIRGLPSLSTLRSRL